MKIQKPDGTVVEVDDSLVRLIQTSNKGGSTGSRLGVDELSEKYPWAAESLKKNGLFQKPNGKGGFKQATTVQCQAGRRKVLTTSKYKGIDSLVPDRVAADGSGTGPAKVAQLVEYNFHALPKCDEEFEVATSDLFQTMLCTGCRATNLRQAAVLKRQIIAQAPAMALEAASQEAAKADAEEVELLTPDDFDISGDPVEQPPE